MLSLLLALALAPVAAAPSVAPSPVMAEAIDLSSLKSGPYRADALAFAEATMPETQFQDMMSAMIERGFREGLGDAASTLEQESPGIVAELQDAIRRSMSTMRSKAYRDTLERYARLYSQTLTPGDTAELTRFFRTPTGQKLIAAKYASVASGSLALDRDTTTGDISQINRRAVSSALGEMGAGDMAELTKVGSLPSFQKLKALTPTVNQLEAAMANEEDPEADQALSDAVEAVMKRRGLGD